MSFVRFAASTVSFLLFDRSLSGCVPQLRRQLPCRDRHAAVTIAASAALVFCLQDEGPNP